MHDMNLMHHLNDVVIRFGGVKTINAYFLNGRLNGMLPLKTFDPEAKKILNALAPLCFYCETNDTTREALEHAMSGADTRFQDRLIVDVINNYSDLNRLGGFEKYQLALDSIAEVLGQMPFVRALKYNSCRDGIAVFPGEITLGVLFETNTMLVEKCYKVQLGAMPKDKNSGPGGSNYLKYINSAICPGFIQAEKKRCGERED
jgi:hypothetical protein